MGKAAWLGVDVGGTWMRVLALDRSGRRVKSASLRAVPRAQFAPELRRLARAWRVSPKGIVLGSTGFGRAADRRSLERELRSVASGARVLTDIDLAWRSALGGPGILIEAGTGSFAYGRDASGRAARVGGLGPMLGDDGSAFWIGREWLRGRPEREALAYAHRPRPQAAIASLAPKVLALARRRGPRARLARRIVAEAQGALALQAKAAASRLRFRGRVPLSWHGGLLEDRGFRSGVLRVLGRGFAPRLPRSRPELAAASLALSLFS